ncbi:efflux RND transporter permease subunit [Endozoicomonas sp. G2_2]|uniref:efflux RND transporter permease subunit n=1 Tax=Endozoicomonas sp. G2_2 TaxID=2821092 RepID=UPI001ADD2E59|nr:efflux RND transporter permease subunit [Endozoicomonas sp. G2_2]MBO9469302.1 efflux RND transporter permease subunit [Endozoicomonas sp. G2_2]
MRTLPAFSVARPVATSMVMAIALLLGGVALSRLPVDLLPNIETPTLTVSVDYENASPETMEELVTRRVEQAVGATPGLEDMESTSVEGTADVTLRFGWGTDIDAAANDVRDRLFSELDELPDDAGRPRIRKFDTSDLPVMGLGLASGIDPIELRRLIDNQLSYRLQQIPGVAAVEVWGEPEREIQVNLDIDRVRALGLSLTDIRDTLDAANRNLPAGSIEIGNQELALRTPGRFKNLDDLRRAVVLVREGTPITLGDIAQVRDTQQRETRLIRINGERGVRMGVRKQSGANTVEVAERITREVERLNREFPQVRITPFFNTADYINRSIANVSRALVYGSVLAFVVLLVFLGHLRAALAVSVAIPVSLIATFALMYGFGYTINLMTLGGLALGVGMMVDSAIVVLENIQRRRAELGESAHVAAVAGSNEIIGPIVASTLTTLAIFIPMLFARELAGQLFRELAIVVALALTCSLIVALTAMPMLTARFVGARRAPQRVAMQRVASTGSQLYARIDSAYRRLLESALAAPRRVVGAAVVATLAALIGFTQLGSEFMPATDEGEVRVSLQMPAGTRLGLLDAQTRKAEAIVRRVVPEAVSVVTSVGSGGYRADGGAEADIRIELPSASARSRTSQQVAADLRGAIGKLADTDVRVGIRQPFFFRMLDIGSDGGSLEIEVRGYDFDVLQNLVARVQERILSIPGITDLRASREGAAPQREIVIDRSAAADLGVTVAAIGQTVETAIAGTNAGYFLDDGDEVRVRVQLANPMQVSANQILDLPVPGVNGTRVKLDDVARVVASEGPVEIDRRNQQRIVSVDANIAGRDLGSVVADVQVALDEIAIPANYDLQLVGEYEAQVAAFREIGVNVALALLLVYMVMACLYESLVDPLIVMVTVPLALIGVVAMLMLTNTTLNSQSMLGCLMLIGIVVNNAILIVDQANLLQREGMDATAAVREAGRRRLRPILMTAATTVFALVPLAIGAGEGSESQAPLARAVVGGMTTATLITLVVIPVVYTGVHRAWPARRASAA